MPNTTKVLGTVDATMATTRVLTEYFGDQADTDHTLVVHPLGKGFAFIIGFGTQTSLVSGNQLPTNITAPAFTGTADLDDENTDLIHVAVKHGFDGDRKTFVVNTSDFTVSETTNATPA